MGIEAGVYVICKQTTKQTVCVFLRLSHTFDCIRYNTNVISKATLF